MERISAGNAPAKAIHLLSGISGWGFPYSEKGAVCVIVRLHYEDGKTEDGTALILSPEEVDGTTWNPLIPGIRFA